MSETDFPNDLSALKIDIAIKYSSYFDFFFFVKKKNNDFVKIEQKAAGLKKTFSYYKEMGLKEIYLISQDYDKIAALLREFLKRNSNFKEAFSDLDQLFSSAYHEISKNGFDEKSAVKCKEINTFVLQHVNMIPTLGDIVSEVKQQNKNTFYQYLAKYYIISCMIDTFEWSTTAIKNKVGQACLLMDINLNDEDLDFMRANPKDSWPPYILNHPAINAKTVKDAGGEISPLVLQIIELHHEVPNAEGLSSGSPQNIPLVAAIVILAEVYTTQILDTNCSPEDKKRILDSLELQFSKGVFRAARESLIASMKKK